MNKFAIKVISLSVLCIVYIYFTNYYEDHLNKLKAYYRLSGDSSDQIVYFIVEKSTRKVIIENRTFDSGQFLVNKRILQYATVISISDEIATKGLLHIESLAFFVGGVANSDTIKCCIRLKNELGNVSYIIKKVNGIVFIEKSLAKLYKVDCFLESGELKETKLNDISVALLDERDYKITNQSKMNDLAFFFHRPRVLQRLKNKIKTTVNCVSPLRGVNDRNRQKSLINWIEINKAIGVGKIFFCLAEYRNNSFMKSLRTNYGEFIDVVEHSVGIEDACKRLEHFFNSTKECKVGFEQTIEEYSNNEKYCANECLLYNKYFFSIILCYFFFCRIKCKSRF